MTTLLPAVASSGDETAVADLLRSAADAARSGSAPGPDFGPAAAEIVALARRLVGSGSPVDRVAADHALTDREAEVLSMVGRGYSNTQIAAGLFVTRSTVAFHLGRIYAKTGARNRHELSTMLWTRRNAA